MNTALTIEKTPEYATLDKQLTALVPKFEGLMSSDCGVPAERIVRTVMLSIERLPKLLECSRQSILNAAMSAAVLGLEVDGVTGQAFLIPFAGKAQLIIGYKGFNTMAARSGYTVNAGHVKEGDGFDYGEGSGAFVTHKKKLGNKGRIVAAWAVAEHKGRPPIVKVLSIDEIMEVKAKSPGGKKKDSPWNDTNGPGFPAMCEKTVIRRLARSMPLNVMQYAATMDEAYEERGLHSRVGEGGPVIEGESSPIAGDQGGQPETKDLSAPTVFSYVVPGTGTAKATSIDEWMANVTRRIMTFKTIADATGFRDANQETFNRLAVDHRDQVDEILGAIEATINTFKEG